MTSSILMTIGLAAALCAAAPAQAADAASAPARTDSSTAAPAPRASTLSHADTSFMKEAAHGGAGEIESAQIAQGKSGNAKIKAFAQQMVTDHTATAAELKSLASSKGYALPDGPTMTQKAKDKMLGMRDNSFDRSYAKMAVSDHEKTVKLFRDASQKAKDPDVRAFAQKTLPALEHHLQMARELQPAVTAER